MFVRSINLLLTALAICLAHTPAVSGTGECSTIQLVRDMSIGLEEAEPPLGNVTDVAVASDGSIFVLDRSMLTINRYDEDGKYEKSIGVFGEGPGDIGNPTCLAVDRLDRVYVTGHNLWIEILDRDGAHQGRIQRVTTEVAQSIAVGPDDTAYVVALDVESQTMIHRYEVRSGQHLGSFGASYARGRNVDVRDEVVNARGRIAVTEERVFYVQSFPHLLREYSLDGTLVRELPARMDESIPARLGEYTANSATVYRPKSFSRTVVPLSDDLVLTNLVFTEPEDDTGYMDIYSMSAGRRVAQLTSPPCLIVFRGDSKGRVYAAGTSGDEPVVTRWLMQW